MTKKIFLSLLFAAMFMPAMGQGCYWVFLTDKQGTSFDPYSYFDAKAIERYQRCGADLYDISNYPLNDNYVQQVGALAIEEVGCSRWLNAVAVMATAAQIARIEQLSCVLRTQALAGDMVPSSKFQVSGSGNLEGGAELADQLLRMQGNLFREKGLDGSGMRIAVLDGGFPRVNTHKAFQHLRDNHRILDTWNFPNRKADVYGWNSHGLMTLSCITGIVGGKQMGLATGAEFLLYRTEVEAEPFKEEVWWQMAMERADQHGANIISSSLGYGKDRHYTYEMDGRSYVARAATMAARKGILVCNSAGNEGDDRQWKTIITPADADSVLCVGGIEASLKKYNHISFSSYGPAADGRLKPDVSAFGHALAAANSSDDATGWVYGTSFSCPLTAGFAACAWQAMRDKTAMQMLREIQQSGDLYPYYDYALGYGVPQASHFVGGKAAVTPTFRIEETQDSVAIRFTKAAPSLTVFYNKQAANSHLVQYGSKILYEVDGDTYLRFHKGAIDSCRLNVWVDGFTASYQGKGLRPQDTGDYSFYGYSSNDSGVNYLRDDDKLIPSDKGVCSKHYSDYYFMLGDNIRTASTEDELLWWSPSFRVGLDFVRNFGKSYGLGLGVEYALTNFRYDPAQSGMDVDVTGIRLNTQNLSLELFQRVRLVPLGLMSKGLHWDLGVYGTWMFFDRRQIHFNDGSGMCKDMLSQYNRLDVMQSYHLQWGVTTRITYDIIGIYARYRLSGLVGNDLEYVLPRLEAGIVLSF